MHKKVNTTDSPFMLNRTNQITWFEFWHPAQAAALEAEHEQNSTIIDANANQDDLEAEMTWKLSVLQQEAEQQKIETIKMIVIFSIMAVVGYVIIKYV